jgi:two-component system response regulator HydG
VGQVVAESAAMREACEVMKRVMPATAPVLVQGERGTGKELVARTIHEEGLCKGGPFLVVDCTRRPEEELAKDLFGQDGEQNCLTVAAGGTLYLEEIGSLPLSLQGKLEKLLANAKSQGKDAVRVIAGSQDPLETMAAKGNFSQSLFQRLRAFRITLPPLRERREDVLGITHYLLKQKSKGSLAGYLNIEPDAELVLDSYRWPGNADELVQAIEEARATAGKEAVSVDDLPRKIVGAVDLEVLKNERQSELAEYKGQALKSFLREKEREYLKCVLDSVDKDKEEAARKLQLDVAGLERHISGDD